MNQLLHSEHVVILFNNNIHLPTADRLIDPVLGLYGSIYVLIAPIRVAALYLG